MNPDKQKQRTVPDLPKPGRTPGSAEGPRDDVGSSDSGSPGRTASQAEGDRDTVEENARH